MNPSSGDVLLYGHLPLRVSRASSCEALPVVDPAEFDLETLRRDKVLIRRLAAEEDSGLLALSDWLDQLHLELWRAATKGQVVERRLDADWLFFWSKNIRIQRVGAHRALEMLARIARRA